jgi:glycosyltransferase involved in cell wall biosynthesis
VTTAARRLRVLGVIASSERGGAERVFASLVNRLDPDRFEVWVAYHPGGPMREEYGEAAGTRAFDLQNVLDPTTVVALARWMKDIRCHIVHTHLWTADLLGGMAAALARVPVRVATVHTEYFRSSLDEPRSRRVRRACLSRSYRSIYWLFDRVVAVSQSIALDLHRRAGLSIGPGRVRVIRNGLDLSRIGSSGPLPDRHRLGLAPQGPVITTVANFAPMKGHRWLVAAMPRVLDRFPDATFVLLGDGKEARSIERLVACTGLASRVHFLGSRADALRLMALADVVVLPSVTAEGLPLVCLEALALRRPVVATRVGGIPEVIEDRTTGLLVPPRDPPALAEAIVAVLSNPILAAQLGEQGCRLVSRSFRAEEMVRRTEKLYLELAGVAAPGGVPAFPSREIA